MAEYPIKPSHNVFKKYRTVNYINSYVFAPPVDLSTNTQIGGVSGSLSSPALLASKLAIDVSRITNFSIVGSDIQCKITGSYVIPISCFFNDSNITYYTDSDGLVTNLRNYAFNGASKIKSIEFKGVINSDGSWLLENSSVLEFSLPNATSILNIPFNLASNLIAVYIPKCTNLGGSSANNSLLSGVPASAIIYAHPSLATNNSGAPDGDLTGRIVRYVTNSTVPNPAITLSAGTLYNTAIQLNFTAPTGSANSIDYYLVYNNGILIGKITASGRYIKALIANTYYNLTVVAVDVFYNKSAVSNSISVTTSNNSNDISVGLVSYYKLNETSGTSVVDSFSENNLTNIGGVSINQSGKIGTSYGVTAANKYLKGNYSGSINTTFSINTWIYRTGNPTMDNATLVEVGNYESNSGFGIWMNLSNQLSWCINQNYNHYSSLLTIPLNTWTMVTMTYDGSSVKMYLNAVLKTTSAQTTNPNPSTFIQFFNEYPGRNALCSIDETGIYNIGLTQGKIDALYNSGTGITL